MGAGYRIDRKKYVIDSGSQRRLILCTIPHKVT